MTQMYVVHVANITGDTAQTGLVDYAALLSRKQMELASGPGFGSVFLSNCRLATLAAPKDWPYVYDDQASYQDMAERFPQRALKDYLLRAATGQGGELPVLVCHVGVRTGALLAPETLR